MHMHEFAGPNCRLGPIRYAGSSMNEKPTLGQVIRTRRLELGLTQEELAERIGEGIRQAEVSRLEHDRVVLPRRARLERIASALDIPPGELLARSGWAGADAVPWTQRDPSSVHNLTAGVDGDAGSVLGDH